MARSIVSDFPGVHHSPFPDRRHRIAFIEIPMAVPGFTLAVLLSAAPVVSQVITIDTKSGGPVAASGPVDREYQQVQPTHVALTKAQMDTRDKLEIVRIMQAEQGFAMRPLPSGHKGLTLEANGKLEPAGEAYLNMVTADGMSVKPGGRVVITDVKIDHNKLVFDLNNGPDGRHRFLRHISIGTGGYDNPVVADTGTPGGARVTLSFKERIPALTGDQVKALLAPLISFDVKTPVQAYTDTLPKPLKQAILDHQALVGMNTDMVLFAKGQPREKYHEMDGQMPVDIWLYGNPPEDVTFVRINGNRVIRVEIAKAGEPVQVFTKDVVDDMMRAAGKPVVEAENVHVIREGDAARNPDTEAPAPPPSLRKAGETLPTDSNNNGQVMKPVHFPKQQPDTQADPYPNGGGAAQQGSAQPAANGQGAGQSSQPGTAQPGTKPAAAGTQARQPTTQPATQPGPQTIGQNPDDDQSH